MVDAAGTTKYNYDGGPPVGKDGPWASDTVSYIYNGTRQRKQSVPLQPAGNAWTNNYGYDALGRMNSVVSPAGSFGFTYATVTLGGYTYVPGEIAQVSLPGGPYVGQTFDSVGRLLTTALKTAGGTVLNSHAYR